MLRVKAARLDSNLAAWKRTFLDGKEVASDFCVSRKSSYASTQSHCYLFFIGIFFSLLKKFRNGFIQLLLQSCFIKLLPNDSTNFLESCAAFWDSISDALAFFS